MLHVSLYLYLSNSNLLYQCSILYRAVSVLHCFSSSQQLKPTMRRLFSTRVVAGAGYNNNLAGVYGCGRLCLSAKGVLQGTFR